MPRAKSINNARSHLSNCSHARAHEKGATSLSPSLIPSPSPSLALCVYVREFVTASLGTYSSSACAIAAVVKNKSGSSLARRTANTPALSSTQKHPKHVTHGQPIPRSVLGTRVRSKSTASSPLYSVSRVTARRAPRGCACASASACVGAPNSAAARVARRARLGSWWSGCLGRARRRRRRRRRRKGRRRPRLCMHLAAMCWAGGSRKGIHSLYGRCTTGPAESMMDRVVLG